MHKFYELDGLVPKLDGKTVLKTIDCHEDSPLYEEMSEELECMREEVLSLTKPAGVLGFGTLPKEIETEKYKAGTPVIYAVMSIGEEISKLSTQAFKEGDYVKGMLADAMADNILFSLEERLMEKLQEFCADLKVGIRERMEAPYDIPMEAQKVAWEYLELEKRFGIGISCGYMFDPVKTSCQVFVLSEEKDLFNAHHDCRNCPNVNCKLRNIPEVIITVESGDEKSTFMLEDGESLLNGLVRSGYYMSAPCGGKGRCGKCKVQVIGGNIEVSAEDKEFFSEKELNEGYRLACKAFPKADLTIVFDANDESQFEILSNESDIECGTNEIRTSDYNKEGLNSKALLGKQSEYEIAIDIGTTTIAMQLLEKTTGNVLETYTCINRQRVCGADVISRIQASVDGKKEILRKIIQKDLLKGIQNLLQQADIAQGQLTRICIAANTTMVHLLMGYDCDTLGVYPFTPVNIDTIKFSFSELFESEECKAEVVILPGISTYVGGDIVSGLYACGVDKDDEISMLIDLGTNGEMALGNRDKIMVTSTAAGPAFEGGNISCGMGSVAGAICSVEIQDKKARVRTIQDQPPVGLCGTGVVETIAELVKHEIVDETGRMDDEFFDDGFPLAEMEDGRKITFSRKDVREIQLAKSAVRAGIETLLLRYGVTKEQVKKVYIAGGFGYKLDIEKAMEIELLPDEFKGKFVTVGNSSLSGAAAFLRNGDSEKALQELLDVSQEINLSADKDFNEFYMDYMMFPEQG